MDLSPPGSSVHGIFQARILDWIAISYSRDLPDLGIEPTGLVSATLAGGFFIPAPPGKAMHMHTHIYNYFFVYLIVLCNF